MGSGPNICAALYDAKSRLPEGSRAAANIEAAITMLGNRIGRDGSAICMKPKPPG
ncbi:MAG: hypothetical protein PHF60_02900 [Candidatus ainarchaeum sp.]|nr:hypothetical protein [Candidatus ainarchaeum sp.]